MRFLSLFPFVCVALLSLLGVSTASHGGVDTAHPFSHDALPPLPSDLFVSLLAALPTGSNVDGLYTDIGSRLGASAFHNVPENFRQLLGLTDASEASSGSLIGGKIGHCFAVGGFNLPSNPNAIAKVTGFLASKVALKQATAEAEAMMKDNGIDADSPLRPMIIQLVGQAGPQITRRIVDCVLSPKTEPTAPEHAFSGEDLISKLPTGAEFKHLFQTLLKKYLANYMHVLAPTVKGMLTMDDLLVGSNCVGGMVGECLATRGWHLEKHTTWFTAEANQMLKGSESSMIAAINSNIDTQLSAMGLSASSRAQVHTIVKDVISTFGIPVMQRAVQCVFDDSLHVGGCDVPKEAKAYEAIEDMEPPMLSPLLRGGDHHRRHHEGKGHHVKVNVAVDLE